MATHASEGGGDRALPTEVIDDLLAADRRQLLLGILRKRGRPMVVEDLAAALCAVESGPDGPPVTAERRRAVREEVFERHLPKLTAVDAVRYDSMVGTIEYVGTDPLCDRLND